MKPLSSVAALKSAYADYLLEGNMPFLLPTAYHDIRNILSGSKGTVYVKLSE